MKEIKLHKVSGWRLSLSPELHESVCEDESEIVTRHVVRLPGDHQHSGQGAGLEVQRQVEVTVGILEGRQGEVGVAWEGGSSAVLEGLLTPLPCQPEGTETFLLAPLQDPAHPRPALQPTVGIHAVDVVRQGHGQDPRAGLLLILQLRYFHLSERVAGPHHARGPLGVREGQLDVTRLEDLPGRPCGVVDVPGRQPQLGQLLLREPLSARLRWGFDINLDLNGDAGLRLPVVLRLGAVESWRQQSEQWGGHRRLETYLCSCSHCCGDRSRHHSSTRTSSRAGWSSFVHKDFHLHTDLKHKIIIEWVLGHDELPDDVQLDWRGAGLQASLSVSIWTVCFQLHFTLSKLYILHRISRFSISTLRITTSIPSELVFITLGWTI